MNTIKRIVLLVLAVMPLCAIAQPAAQQLPLDKDLRYGKLENGITYYIRHNEEPKDRVNFYIAQKVGSVQEEDSQRGLAHFLEHMCFNGSVNFNGDRGVVKYCESIGVKFGANLNAYTSTDETVYNIDDVPVVEANIDSCLLILHDWADGLLLTTEEIDKERGVIHEEWRMRSVGQQRMLERQLPVLYPGSRYGYRMPIGTMEVVDNFPPDVLRAYYERWYRPDLQGIVVVGDIDVASIEEKIKAVFGPIKMPQEVEPYVLYPVPSNEEPIYAVDSDKEMSNPLIIAMFKSEPMGVEMNGTVYHFMQKYMTSIIGSVLDSRFDELSKTADCPFVMAQAGYGKYLVSKTMDCFELVVIPKPGRDAEAVKVAMSEIERARRFGLTATEVSRAREEFLSRQEEIFDNRDKQKSRFFIQRYVRHFLENNAVPGIEMEYNIYKTLAPQIPAEALNQTLGQMTESIGKDFVFLAMYPQKDGVAVPTAADFKAAIEGARAAEVEAYVDNVKNEPLISKMPKKGKIKKETPAQFGYTQMTLSNGIKLFYKQTDFSNTEVLFTAVSKGGTSLLPESDMLNANITCDVVNSSGVGNFTSTELEKALAGKQVSIKTGMGSIRETVSGRSTPKDMRTLFELAYLGFTAPADDPDAYNNYINTVRVTLENAEKLPMNAFQDSIRTTLFGNNPRKASIKLADLEKLSYEEVKRIYKDRFCNPADFEFYVTGAFSVDSLRAFTEQYIASLPKAGKKENFINHKLYIKEGSVENRFRREMETPQAYVLQVWSGATPYSLKESMVVDALGSILSKRYLKSIREDAGFTYSVQALAQASYETRDEYAMQVVCPFTPEKVDSVMYLINKEIAAIGTDGVTADELAEVVKFKLKNYNDNQRKNMYWQSNFVILRSYGKDEITDYDTLVQSITSDDIKAFVNDVVIKQNNCRTIIMLPAQKAE